MEPLSQALPTEILEAIIGNLDPNTQDGRQSLLSGSYTGRVMLAACQQTLFRNTDIRVDVSRRGSVVYFVERAPSTGRKLLCLLDESPHIASYIRSLTISFGSIKPWHRVQPWAQDTPGFQFDDIPSNSSSFPLYSIMPKLVKVTGLAFKGPGRHDWDDVDPTIQTFLRGVVQNLKMIDIASIASIPTSLFLDCRSLETLHVGSLRVERNIEHFTKAKLTLLHVRTWGRYMVIDEHLAPFEAFDASFFPFDFTRLTTLIASVEDLSAVHGILRFCGDTLETMELPSLRSAYASTKKVRLSYNSNDTSMPLYEDVSPDLSYLQRLRRIRLSCFIYGFGNRLEYDTEMPYACALLSRLPRRPNSRNEAVQVMLDVAILQVAEEDLGSIAWSDIIGVNLPEEVIAAIPLALQLGFCHQTGMYSTPYVPASRLKDILDENEYLAGMKRKGLLLYDAFEPSIAIP